MSSYVCFRNEETTDGQDSDNDQRNDFGKSENYTEITENCTESIVEADTESRIGLLSELRTG